MRPSQTKLLLAIAAAVSAGTAGAGSWEPVVKLNGQAIELDTSRVGRMADGRATAWSRVALQRELIDETGMRYTAVEALNRYDCEKHSFATLKRIYRRDGKTVRTEAVGVPREMTADPGSPDDKLLSEICKASVAREATEKGGVPVVDAKPTVIYADVRSAEAAAPSKPADKAADAKTADKPAEKSEAKPERHRYVEIPKIDKSKVEDPNPPAKSAEAKEEKPAKNGKADKAAAKPAERPADRVSAYRAELERQYAGSGPRRATAPKPKRDPAETDYRDIPWSYEGAGAPANWAKLNPDYATCAAGKRQSPIDVRDTIRVDLEPIKFDYKPSRLTIIDSGRTIEVNVEEGSSMRIMDRTYQLVQFDFHKPGEERINGRMYDMAVHLVHRDDVGRIAVIAVPLEKGSEHPLIQAVWNNLPLDKNQPVSPSVLMDPGLLLPPPERRTYYTYMGSLTAPPCTEDVLWMVFKQPQQISPQQIGVFSHLYMNNARPVQPSYGRLIKENR